MRPFGPASPVPLLLAVLGALLCIGGCTTPPPPPTPVLLPSETPAPTHAPAATPTPTATPTAAPTDTPTPTDIPTPLPRAVLLEPMNHQPQTLNNCGPASVAIVLGYYDRWVTQRQVQEGSAHVPYPCFAPYYVSTHGLAARVLRFPVDPDLRLAAVRVLLANGIPVIVLQRLSLDSSLTHYRVVQGYDDDAQELICDDPLLGPDYRIPYETFVKLTAGGGSPLLIPVYRPEREARIQSLLQEGYARRWTDREGQPCAEATPPAQDPP